MIGLNARQLRCKEITLVKRECGKALGLFSMVGVD